MHIFLSVSSHPSPFLIFHGAVIYTNFTTHKYFFVQYHLIHMKNRRKIDLFFRKGKIDPSCCNFPSYFTMMHVIITKCFIVHVIIVKYFALHVIKAKLLPFITPNEAITNDLTTCLMHTQSTKLFRFCSN